VHFVPVQKDRVDKPVGSGGDSISPLTNHPWQGLLGPSHSCAWLGSSRARGTKGLLPVSVFPCSICRRRMPGKLASAYWAWFDAEGNRSAWKLRYCPGCAVESLQKLLSTLHSADQSEDVFACVSCGANAETDSDPIYLTLYLPGKEPTEWALQLDGACAAKLRIPITTQGERLADRGGLVRGPSPSTSVWDAMGLAPS
jgi:hypothetical protein